jgi:predicted nucleic acid-binding protein
MARRQRFRLVIDTMVVIRGARAFRQQPPIPTTAELQLLLGWIDDETLFDWLYSPPILDEYRTVLRRLKVPAHAVGRFLNLLRQAGMAVEARDLGPFSPDPDDDPFYHCALVGRADAIVTDNIGDFPPIPGRKRPEILTPAAVVARLWSMQMSRGRRQERRSS